MSSDTFSHHPGMGITSLCPHVL